ncbi:MAG TPA: radical SAM protein [Candidatus Polarisedimenticolaceae bacterium]|nr:radical SAM protein [Candidatus Polarisedimenticolaceae bacterium]
MLRVNEIFHSIQGESTHAGRPCVFVRLTGCPLRCVWCDTAYAFHEGSPMSVEGIVERVLSYGCPLVELTGGEPLAQPRSIDLLEALLARGLEVLLETSGALPIARVPFGVKRILDVKCPGSGEAHRNLWENLDALREGDEIKFVLAARADYDWAKDVVCERGLERRAPVLFSAVRETLDPGVLASWVLEDRLPVRLQVQMHKVLWPEALRGV